MNIINHPKTSLKKRVIINSLNAQTILGGVIDSTVEYFLDGGIDMGSVSIEVPIGGINISGYGYGVSKLFSNEDNYTMFTSPVGGSGGLVFKDFTICVDGANSKVYDLEDVNGFNAVELSNFNYENCTSLGELNGYRQGLEVNTGRFGGSPELTLSGTWLGGFRVSTSIVRSLDNTWSGTLFKAGLGLVFNSRFVSDINCDLGTNSSLFDFSPSNFNGTSLLQLKNCIVTREGVNNPDDTNLTPNISASDVESVWRNNQGLHNTYVGVRSRIDTEVETVISSIDTYVNVAGVWSDYDLEHFDSPSNGQWRNLGDSPIDFKFHFPIILKGLANDEYTIRIRKYDSVSTLTTTLATQKRKIQNVVGSNDVSYFNLIGSGTIKNGDYVFLDVANNTGTANCTLLTGSEIEIIER